jgi:ribosome biogenesis GTPase
VGKSSLLRSVQPGLDLRTSDVSDRRHEGRHTTTQASLHRLEDGGFVIDSPGIREWGLAGLRRRQLGQFYPEIAALAPDCRFADCAHLDEPGCAVRDALRRGGMAPMRYQSYCKIYATLEA